MSDFDSEVVSRSAPRWAWDTIDETLAMDAKSKAFTAELRDQIDLAVTGMTLCCEEGYDSLSQVEAKTFKGGF